MILLPQLLAPGQPFLLAEPFLALLAVAPPVSQHQHEAPERDREELEREADGAADGAGEVPGLYTPFVSQTGNWFAPVTNKHRYGTQT